MNILFLSTRSPYPLISGHSLRTYHILKGAAQKHRVTFLTYTQLPEHELKKTNLDHLRGFCHEVYPFRIPVDESRFNLTISIFRNMFSPLPFVAHKYGTVAMRQQIRKILKKQTIDLVHVDLLPLSIYYNEFNELPKILVNHNVESLRLLRWYQTEPNWVKRNYLGLQYLKLRSFERSAMEKFDCCVVVSELDKQVLVNMGVENNIFVVPNGTDTDFFKPGGKETIENSVLWLGHMDVHTNKDAVLYYWQDIFPIIRKRYPQMEMIFVGTSPPREIADFARSDPNVKVTGFVNDIRPYLETAAVMVVPIRIGSGTRLKILDAMAMGKAIVSTSVGCEGLGITDGKNILVADNPEEFASQVLSLLRNQSLRNDIEKNARNLAEKYDWNYLNMLQEDVYQSALQKHSFS